MYFKRFVYEWQYWTPVPFSDCIEFILTALFERPIPLKNLGSSLCTSPITFIIAASCRWSRHFCRPWRIRRTLASRPTQLPPSLTSLRTVLKPCSSPIWTASSSTCTSSWSPNSRRCSPVSYPFNFIYWIG